MYGLGDVGQSSEKAYVQAYRGFKALKGLLRKKEGKSLQIDRDWKRHACAVQSWQCAGCNPKRTYGAHQGLISHQRQDNNAFTLGNSRGFKPFSIASIRFFKLVCVPKTCFLISPKNTHGIDSPRH